MIGSCQKQCSQDSKCWRDRRASSGCRKHLGAAVASPWSTLGPHFLDSAWMLPHESHMSRVPHPGQHSIMSAGSPPGAEPRSTLATAKRSAEVPRQPGPEEQCFLLPWSTDLAEKHACLQGLTHCLKFFFFASLSHQSWEILSVLQRKTDDHSRACLG